MGILGWGSGATQPAKLTPRLTVHCEYPDDGLAPTVVSFRLSPSYGLLTATDVHNWFVSMLEEHEEFEVETDGVKNGARVGKHRSYERHSPKSGSGSA